MAEASDCGKLAPRSVPLVERLKFEKQQIESRAAELTDAGAPVLAVPTDVSDVTGSTYTYLINGHGPADNWTALFAAGERVRLRDRRTGEVTWVMVLRGNDGKARIGIDASADVDIVREELRARSGTTPGEGSSPAGGGLAKEGPV